MVYTRKLKSASAILLSAMAGSIAATAWASPGAGITVENFVTADFEETAQINNDRVKMQTKDRTDVRVQRLTFGAGAYSGWHHHPGVLIVAVASGSVTLMDANCGSKTYGPGQPNGEVFVEGHEAAQQAVSPDGATVYVTYVAPSAEPPVFRVEDSVPFCAQ
jgi:quercetin dioxygenase-like cupin family protein